MISTTNKNITEAVRKLYERFPYPNYPIWADLHWQDGYAATSEFASSIYEHQTNKIAAIHLPKNLLDPEFKTVLVAGSGETLPYIIRKLEPHRHRILAVDLSARNIKRAKWRLLGRTLKATQFIRADINKYLKKFGNITGPYDHIDAYGVLHHLPNPTEALQLFGEKLHRRGTIRVMVYNSHARQWIRNFQKTFKLLQLNPEFKQDIDQARRIFALIALNHRPFRQILSYLGQDQIENTSRFVDTFFHPREANIAFEKWIEAIKGADLQPIGLLDRLGELDDLPNPLLCRPSFDQIIERIKDHRFTQNLDLYLAKTDAQETSTQQDKPTYTPTPPNRPLLKFRSCPQRWLSYPETTKLSLGVRRQIWLSHIDYVYGDKTQLLDTVVDKVHITTLQRLARIGAIFPKQFSSEKIRSKLLAPIYKSKTMTRVTEIEEPSLRATAFSEEIMNILQRKKIFSERRFNAVIDRCQKGIHCSLKITELG
jgi:SAM-dependent methyltransferase